MFLFSVFVYFDEYTTSLILNIYLLFNLKIIEFIYLIGRH